MQGSQTFVIDIDDTISIINSDQDYDGPADYPSAEPIPIVINKINKLYNQGHTIILLTSRGMRTFKGVLADIEAFHRPILDKWLSDNNVNYHELHFGKPWGPDVRYIDDRGLTIDQFVDTESEDYNSCLTANKSKTYAKL